MTRKTNATMSAQGPSPAVGHMPFDGHRSCAHLISHRNWRNIPSWTSEGTRYTIREPRPVPPASRSMRRRYKALKWLENLNDWTPYSAPWTLSGPLMSARRSLLCETREINCPKGYRIGCNWRINSAGVAWLRKFEEIHPEFGTINLNPYVQQA